MAHSKLIVMANQIAAFFKSQPGDADGAVAAHIQKFWAPDMRRDLAEALTQGQADGLDLLAREAVARLKPDRKQTTD